MSKEKEYTYYRSLVDNYSGDKFSDIVVDIVGEIEAGEMSSFWVEVYEDHVEKKGEDDFSYTGLGSAFLHCARKKEFLVRT